MKFGILFHLKLDYPLKFSVSRISLNFRLQFLYWLKKHFCFQNFTIYSKNNFHFVQGRKDQSKWHFFVRSLFVFFEDLWRSSPSSVCRWSCQGWCCSCLPVQKRKKWWWFGATNNSDQLTNILGPDQAVGDFFADEAQESPPTSGKLCDWSLLVDWTETRVRSKTFRVKYDSSGAKQWTSSWGLLQWKSYAIATDSSGHYCRTNWWRTGRESAGYVTLVVVRFRREQQSGQTVSIIPTQPPCPETGLRSCWFQGLGSSKASCHLRNSAADFPASKWSSRINCSTFAHLLRIRECCMDRAFV